MTSNLLSLVPVRPEGPVMSLVPVGAVAPTHHFGSLRFSLGLDDLLLLVLLGLLHVELGSLRLLLGCRGTSQHAKSTEDECHPSAGQPTVCPSVHPSSPTCLASTAAVYSRLKLSSVMATSSKMMLKSLALSNSSLRISSDTCRTKTQRVSVYPVSGLTPRDRCPDSSPPRA